MYQEMKGGELECLILFGATLLVASCSAAGTLNVLAIGQVMPGESPIPAWFDADPLVSYVLIPTDIDIQAGESVAGEMVLEDRCRRYVRIYFPKNRAELTTEFEFLVFPDGYLEPFTTRQIEDMKYAVGAGLGSFVSMGGDLSAPRQKSYPGWKSSDLNAILPVELVQSMEQHGSRYRIEVCKQRPELLSMFIPFGIEEVSGSGGFTNLYPKSGTATWAMLICTSFPGNEDEWLVSWRYGTEGGYSWALADDLDHPWWSSVHSISENDYALDLFLNILLFSTGRPMARDVLLVHKVRDGYYEYDQKKKTLLSLLEFVDKFGATTGSLNELIDEADKLKMDSFDLYRRQEFSDALSRIEEAVNEIHSIGNRPLKLRKAPCSGFISPNGAS